MVKMRIRAGKRIAISFAISFFFALQSFLIPLAQASMANAAALYASLNVICSTGADHQAGSSDQERPVHCELPCCLASRRADIKLDVPALEPFALCEPPLLHAILARPHSIESDLLRDDFASSRQNWARAPPQHS